MISNDPVEPEKKIHLAFEPVSADLPAMNIESELICHCGCERVLDSCSCATAGQMRDSIQAMVEEGRTQQEILDHFVAQYGEKVLASR